MSASESGKVSAAPDGGDASKQSNERGRAAEVAGLLWFLIIGIVAGWTAGKITRGRGFGLLGNLVVGVIGAMVGGFLFGLIGWSAHGLVGSIGMAIVGAVVLLSLIQFVR